MDSHEDIINLQIMKTDEAAKAIENDFKTMFTLYRMVKRSVTESVPDRTSVHIRNAAFEGIKAPK